MFLTIHFKKFRILFSSTHKYSEIVWLSPFQQLTIMSGMIWLAFIVLWCSISVLHIALEFHNKICSSHNKDIGFKHSICFEAYRIWVSQYMKHYDPVQKIRTYCFAERLEGNFHTSSKHKQSQTYRSMESFKFLPCIVLF